MVGYPLEDDVRSSAPTSRADLYVMLERERRRVPVLGDGGEHLADAVGEPQRDRQAVAI